MSTFYQRGAEKRRNWQEMRVREEVSSAVARPGSPKPPEMEQEKRMRREIANSNERRRMQSINAGFQSLKSMIPHQDGEKLSKAAILQHTTDYIFRLQRDRTQLISENNEIKQMLRELGHGQNNTSPPPKRKKHDTECLDEGISMYVDAHDDTTDEYKRELVDLRQQLERERKQRMQLEKRLCENNPELDCDTIYENHNKENDALSQKWIKEEGDEETSQPVPRPPAAISPYQASVPTATVTRDPRSVACRNLETIMEAIRHLEGEAALRADGGERRVPECVSLPHSEESGTESSYDHEENTSPGSSSPSSSQMECETSVTVSPTFAASPAMHMPPPGAILHPGLIIPRVEVQVTPYVTPATYTLPLQFHTSPVTAPQPYETTPEPHNLVVRKS